MWGVTDLGTYLIGLVLIILLPGPNSMYVLSVAARRGVRSGYAAAGGVFVGDAVLMVASAAGVASILRTNDLAFSVVKYLGAGYLGWLAFGMLRGAWSMWRRKADDEVADVVLDRGVPVERPFRRALVVSLLNPKAILFFIAFFVQFVDPSYAYPALFFLFLGVFVEAASFLYLSALIFAGANLAAAVRRRRALATGGTTLVGVAFLGFAVKLALASAV